MNEAFKSEETKELKCAITERNDEINKLKNQIAILKNEKEEIGKKYSDLEDECNLADMEYANTKGEATALKWMFELLLKKQ